MPPINFVKLIGSLFKLVTFKVAGTALVAPNFFFVMNAINKHDYASSMSMCFPAQTNAHIFCAGGIMPLLSAIVVAGIGFWLVVEAINDFKKEAKTGFNELMIS